MTFFLRTDFVDSDISYGGTKYHTFQGLCQWNGGGIGLRICVSTYIIKLLRQKVRSIPLNASISTTKKTIAYLVCFDDMDISVEV